MPSSSLTNLAQRRWWDALKTNESIDSKDCKGLPFFFFNKRIGVDDINWVYTEKMKCGRLIQFFKDRAQHTKQKLNSSCSKKDLISKPDSVSSG